MWLLMAACKNLLCVNSFTEANQRHALVASKQIGMANDEAGGFERRSWFFLSIFVFEQEGDAQRPTHRKHSLSQDSA